MTLQTQSEGATEDFLRALAPKHESDMSIWRYLYLSAFFKESELIRNRQKLTLIERDYLCIFSSVQLLSRVRLLETP